MRKALWILLAAICVATPAAAGCLATETIAQGAMSGANVSGTCESGNCPGVDLVIQDRDSWKKLWLRHTSNLSPTPPLPEVDFRRQVVLASFLGTRPSTSYGVDIACVEPGLVSLFHRSRLMVNVTDISPGSGCIVQPAITNPFHFVKLDRPNSGPFISVKPGLVSARFNHSDYVIACPGDTDPICRVCIDGDNGGVIDVIGNPTPCCP